MAPKSMLKRPAARGRPRSHHLAVAPGSVQNIASKPAQAALAKEDKCRLIADAVAAADWLPQVVRSMLAYLVIPGFATEEHGRHPYQATALNMLRETLGSIEDSMVKDMETAQAAVNEADANKQGREEKLSMAELHLASMQARVIESKEQLAAASKALAHAAKVLACKEAEKKKTIANATSRNTCLERLQLAQHNTYLPFKEAAAKGVEGGRSLRDLRKVGKEFGFHDILLHSVPDVLRKTPSRRQTFDHMALDQLEKEFARHLERAMHSVEASRQEVASFEEAVQQSQKLHTAVAERQALAARGVDEAEATAADARSCVESTRSHLEHFKMEMLQSAHTLENSKACLDSFRTGPLAAFLALEGLDGREVAPMPSGLGETEEALAPSSVNEMEAAALQGRGDSKDCKEDVKKLAQAEKAARHCPESATASSLPVSETRKRKRSASRSRQ